MMDKRALRVCIVLSLFLTPLMFGIQTFEVAKANPFEIPPPNSIYIQSDGSINGTDKIYQNENVYTLTDSLILRYKSILILKDTIVLDGDGFTLQGDGSPISVGIFIENRNNVTVRNFIITDFNHGIDCIGSSSVQITHNSLTGNNIGIQTFYDIQETMIVVYNNSFLNNTFHVSPTSGFNWDNGKTGNFWSSYNGTDAHGDGIGDTPYIIDANNKDNYPLMLPINFTVDLYPTPQSTTTPSLSPTPSPTKSPS